MHTSLGQKSLGRRCLGGSRFVTYGTVPSMFTQYGRRVRRVKWHGMDPDAVNYIQNAFFCQTDVGSGANRRNQIYGRNTFSAIDVLVKSMKDAGLWSLCKAVYPMCAGMHRPSVSFATYADSWNLKDPRDTSAAFPNGYNSVISSELGDRVTTVGNAGDTVINAASVLTKLSWHLACYISDVPTSNQALIGAGSTTTFGIQVGTTGITLLGNGSGGAFAATRDIKGFIVGTRRSSTDLSIFRKGDLLTTDTSTGSSNLPSANIFTFFGYDASTGYTSGWMRFASIGDGLTDDQAKTYTQIVQKFQTTLGRAV